ncbi:MAG: hypothetical protein H7338_24680 [Candidatus Sericytochromatia bacterium]|nr:hypothetical protein [Candidatus Sericytochromatia bacterium]
MHLTLETLAAYAEGLLSASETKAAHTHLLTCPTCGAGVADQLAIIHALARLPQPVATRDDWDSVVAALGGDWHQGATANQPLIAESPMAKTTRPYLHQQKNRWVAAALLTVGLAGGLLLTFVQPAPAEDETDSFWREHHSFSSHNSLSGRHLSSYRSLADTRQMNQDTP